jgi:hypothetical protein
MMCYYPFVVLQLAVTSWSLFAVQGQDPCEFTRWRYQALSHDSACFCDSIANGTICQPNDLCFSVPPEDFVDNEDYDYDEVDFSKFECVLIPCDDVSGNWIWVGRQTPLSANFTAWGTVQVRQNNCQAEFTVVSTNATGIITTTTFYASMTWQEVYALNLFLTEEERDAYESFEGDDPPGSIIPENSYGFIQNFESSAPQCDYYGSFIDTDIQNMEDTGVYGMVRDVGGLFDIGDTIPDSFLYNCPEGFPRQWTKSNDLSAPAPPTSSGFPTPSPSTTPSSGFHVQPLLAFANVLLSLTVLLA